jgi:hypothetical protein
LVVEGGTNSPGAQATTEVVENQLFQQLHQQVVVEVGISMHSPGSSGGSGGGGGTLGSDILVEQEIHLQLVHLKEIMVEDLEVLLFNLEVEVVEHQLLDKVMTEITVEPVVLV